MSDQSRPYTNLVPPDAPATHDSIPELAPDLVPSLREVVEREGLNERQLEVQIDVGDQQQIVALDRHLIPLCDDQKAAVWNVPSLRELFRGNRQPPAAMNQRLSEPPREYWSHFYFIEGHLLSACDVQGDQTDQELEASYGMLRRRPDGRSLGPTHDFLWQVAALRLGTHVLSQLEFEAIAGRLERSARTWAKPPISREYVQHLRQHI